MSQSQYKVGYELSVKDHLSKALEKNAKLFDHLEKLSADATSHLGGYFAQAARHMAKFDRGLGKVISQYGRLNNAQKLEAGAIAHATKLERGRLAVSERIHREQVSSLHTLRLTTAELAKQDRFLRGMKPPAPVRPSSGAPTVDDSHGGPRTIAGYGGQDFINAAMGGYGRVTALADVSSAATAAAAKSQLSGYSPEEFARLQSRLVPDLASKYHLSRAQGFEIFNELQAAGVGLHEQTALAGPLAKFLRYREGTGSHLAESDLGNLAKVADQFGVTAGKTSAARESGATSFMNDFTVAQLAGGGKVNTQWMQQFSQSSASQLMLSGITFQKIAPLLDFMASEFKYGGRAGTNLAALERGFMVNGTNTRQMAALLKFGLVENAHVIPPAGKKKGFGRVEGHSLLFGLSPDEQGRVIQERVDRYLTEQRHLTRGSAAYKQAFGQELRDIAGTAPALMVLSKLTNARDRELMERDIGRYNRVLAGGGREGVLDRAYQTANQGYLGSKQNQEGDFTRLQENAGKAFEAPLARINQMLGGVYGKLADAIAKHPHASGAASGGILGGIGAATLLGGAMLGEGALKMARMTTIGKFLTEPFLKAGKLIANAGKVAGSGFMRAVTGTIGRLGPLLARIPSLFINAARVAGTGFARFATTAAMRVGPMLAAALPEILTFGGVAAAGLLVGAGIGSAIYAGLERSGLADKIQSYIASAMGGVLDGGTSAAATRAQALQRANILGHSHMTPEQMHQQLQGLHDFNMHQRAMGKPAVGLAEYQRGHGGPITINVHGVHDPKAVANEVAGILDKRMARGTVRAAKGSGGNPRPVVTSTHTLR